MMNHHHQRSELTATTNDPRPTPNVCASGWIEEAGDCPSPSAGLPRPFVVSVRTDSFPRSPSFLVGVDSIAPSCSCGRSFPPAIGGREGRALPAGRLGLACAVAYAAASQSPPRTTPHRACRPRSRFAGVKPPQAIGRRRARAPGRPTPTCWPQGAGCSRGHEVLGPAGYLCTPRSSLLCTAHVRPRPPTPILAWRPFNRNADASISPAVLCSACRRVDSKSSVNWTGSERLFLGHRPSPPPPPRRRAWPIRRGPAVVQPAFLGAIQ